MSPSDATVEAAAHPPSGPTLPRWFEAAEEALVVATLGLTFLVLLLQVFSRYLFNWPLSWTEELARYLFVWTVFFGASQAMAHAEHIAIGMVIERLPRRAAQVVALAMLALMAVFLLVVVIKGYELAMKVIDLPSTALEWPMTFVYAPAPLAALVMLARLALEARHVVLAGPSHIEHRSL